jgi:proline-specific peptidase
VRSAAEGRLAVPGGTVWYRVVGSGARPPLLVVHGGLGSVSHDYLDPLGALAAAGRRVVFWDQLGCGRSDAPEDPAVYRIERYVEEVAAVREGLGLYEVHVVGQSYGGWLTVEYLLGRPAGVLSAHLASTSASARSLLSAMARLRAALPSEVSATLDRGEGRGDLDDPAYREAAAFFDRRHGCRIEPPPEPLRRALALAGHGPQYRLMNGPNEFVLTGNLGTWDRRDRLAELDLPALVSCGRFDKFAVECSVELQRGMPRSTLHVFERSSHMSHLEQPERFLEVSGGLLDSVDRAA